jgi:hypothetical protein
MEKRGCRSVIAYSALGLLRSADVNLTMPSDAMWPGIGESDQLRGSCYWRPRLEHDRIHLLAMSLIPP